MSSPASNSSSNPSYSNYSSIPPELLKKLKDQKEKQASESTSSSSIPMGRKVSVKGNEGSNVYNSFSEVIAFANKPEARGHEPTTPTGKKMDNNDLPLTNTQIKEDMKPRIPDRQPQALLQENSTKAMKLNPPEMQPQSEITAKEQLKDVAVLHLINDSNKDNPLRHAFVQYLEKNNITASVSTITTDFDKFIDQLKEIPKGTTKPPSTLIKTSPVDLVKEFNVEVKTNPSNPKNFAGLHVAKDVNNPLREEFVKYLAKNNIQSTIFNIQENYNQFIAQLKEVPTGATRPPEFTAGSEEVEKLVEELNSNVEKMRPKETRSASVSVSQTPVNRPSEKDVQSILKHTEVLKKATRENIYNVIAPRDNSPPKNILAVKFTAYLAKNSIQLTLQNLKDQFNGFISELEKDYINGKVDKNVIKDCNEAFKNLSGEGKVGIGPFKIQKHREDSQKENILTSINGQISFLKENAQINLDNSAILLSGSKKEGEDIGIAKTQLPKKYLSSLGGPDSSKIWQSKDQLELEFVSQMPAIGINESNAPKIASSTSDFNNYGLKVDVDEKGKPKIEKILGKPVSEEFLQQLPPGVQAGFFKFTCQGTEVSMQESRKPIYYDTKNNLLFQDLGDMTNCDAVNSFNNQIFVVADGNGVGKGSALAASKAVEESLNHLKVGISKARNLQEMTQLGIDAVLVANKQISQIDVKTGKTLDEEDNRRLYGSTTLIQGMVVKGENGKDYIHVTSVGDSCLAVIRAGKFINLNERSAHTKSNAGGSIGDTINLPGQEGQKIADLGNLTVLAVEILPGDKFILGSDGVFDNQQIFSDEFCKSLENMNDPNAMKKTIEQTLYDHTIQYKTEILLTGTSRLKGTKKDHANFHVIAPK